MSSQGDLKQTMNLRSVFWLGASIAGAVWLRRRLWHSGTSFSVKEQVVIITGASAGIGRAAAHTFARHGANVVLVARHNDALAAVQSELKPFGVDTLVIPADITDEADRNRVIDGTLAHFGQIDVLVNSAGITTGGRFDNIPHQRIEQVLNVNLSGLIHLTQLALRQMRKQGSGHIVNISSVAADIRAPGQAVYSATKAAINALGDALHRELLHTNIHVSTIMPAWTRTRMVSDEALRALRRARLYSPLLPLQEPEYIGERIVQSVQQRHRQVIMGGLGFQAGVLMSRLAPAFMDTSYEVYFDPDKVTDAMSTLERAL